MFDDIFGLIVGAIGVFIIITVAFVALSLPVMGLSTVISRLLARWITPSGHKRYGNVRDSEGSISLKADGYSVTIDWSAEAVASLMKTRSQ